MQNSYVWLPRLHPRPQESEGEEMSELIKFDLKNGKLTKRLPKHFGEMRMGKLHRQPEQQLQPRLAFTVLGQLPRKSNSRRLFRNRSTGRPIIIKSAKALNYECSFATQVVGVSKNMFQADDKIMLSAQIYYSSRRLDLSDELLCDLLEKTGIIKQDRQIFEKHLYKGLDKLNPRVEVVLELVGKNENC